MYSTFDYLFLFCYFALEFMLLLSFLKKINKYVVVFCTDIVDKISHIVQT